MTEPIAASPGPPNRYSIRVEDHLGPEWTDWFDGLTIHRHPDGTTTLEGPISDQAALHGVLLKVRDLGLALVAVNPIELNRGKPCSMEDGARNSSELGTNHQRSKKHGKDR